MPFCINASHFAPFIPFNISGNPEELLFLPGSVSHHRACFFSLGVLFLINFYPVLHVPPISADTDTSAVHLAFVVCRVQSNPYGAQLKPIKMGQF